MEVPSTFEVVIRPGSTARGYWRDVWQAREVLWFLTWREILVRYKRTAIGVVWSVIRPLLLMAVFTLIFGRAARFAPEGGTHALKDTHLREVEDLYVWPIAWQTAIWLPCGGWRIATRSGTTWCAFIANWLPIPNDAASR